MQAIDNNGNSLMAAERLQRTGQDGCCARFSRFVVRVVQSVKAFFDELIVRIINCFHPEDQDHCGAPECVGSTLSLVSQASDDMDLECDHDIATANECAVCLTEGELIQLSGCNLRAHAGCIRDAVRNAIANYDPSHVNFHYNVDLVVLPCPLASSAPDGAHEEHPAIRCMRLDTNDITERDINFKLELMTFCARVQGDAMAQRPEFQTDK